MVELEGTIVELICTECREAYPPPSPIPPPGQALPFNLASKLLQWQWPSLANRPSIVSEVEAFLWHGEERRSCGSNPRTETSADKTGIVYRRHPATKHTQR